MNETQKKQVKEMSDLIKNYAAKWFRKGRDYGQAPITKGLLEELEDDGAQILAIIEKAGKASGDLLSDGEIENERLTYLQEGDDTIDEAVLYNATIHLECLSDSAYMLIMHNARHYWHFSIFSKSGKAHLKARLLEDRS